MIPGFIESLREAKSHVPRAAFLYIHPRGAANVGVSDGDRVEDLHVVLDHFCPFGRAYVVAKPTELFPPPAPLELAKA